MIPVAEVQIGDKEKEYVNDCLTTGWISSLGKYVTAFEQSFAHFCGRSYGVATSNGTTALHLALAALKVGPGDEVIVPSLTFVATGNAVVYTGARPVLVDCDPYTWTLDPQAVAAAVTPRTRAIIPVHLYGHPADMDPILALARERGIAVIEDAAEAHGARYKGRMAGALGTVGCFSFYGNKVITTGEGGMVVADDEELVQRMAWLRDHAMSKERRYWHTEVGFNYRLTNIQAAIGLGQLERIDEILAQKRRVARLYSERLAEVEGLTLPPTAPWAENVYWMYSVLIQDSFGLSRDEVMAGLRRQGVDSRPFFHPLHTLPPYERGERLPVSEDVAARGINLPSSPSLTEEQVDFICQALIGLRSGHAGS